MRRLISGEEAGRAAMRVRIVAAAAAAAATTGRIVAMLIMQSEVVETYAMMSQTIESFRVFQKGGGEGGRCPRSFFGLLSSRVLPEDADEIGDREMRWAGAIELYSSYLSGNETCFPVFLRPFPKKIPTNPLHRPPPSICIFCSGLSPPAAARLAPFWGGWHKIPRQRTTRLVVSAS
nr:hypothetical protein CFP56_64625 [Quercus suber]